MSEETNRMDEVTTSASAEDETTGAESTVSVEDAAVIEAVPAETVEAVSDVTEPVAEAEATISSPESVDMDDAAPVAQPRSIGELRPAMELRGTVKRIELYGAFVDIGIGTDGLLHISQLGKPNVRNVEDVVKSGQNITVYVLRVDKEQGRIALSLSRPPAMPWDDIKVGTIVNGTVVRLEQFGVFVDFGAERPGMIHVSELASGYVSTPSDVVKVGDEVRAKVIKINRKQKRIDLSLKELEEKIEMPQEEPDAPVLTAMELALRRAMEGSTNNEFDEFRSGGGNKKNDRKRDQRRSRRDRDEMEDIFERTLRGRDR